MILVCGEALLDVFAAEPTRNGLMLQANVGGSPFNVAVGLARMGQPVSFLGAVSRGFAGERLMQALVAEGVDTGTAARVDAPTTLSLVGLDASGVPSYSFYGDGCADRLLGAADLARIPAELAAVTVGSYATVVDPIGSTLRTLIERQHGRALIAFDPNIRLNVQPDIGVWRDHFAWMLPRTDLLKVSEEDLQLLRPQASLEVVAHEALNAGVRCAVITRGARGAVAWTATATVTATPETIDVVDTVGAGDTFLAALLTWLAEHGSLASDKLSTLREDQLAGALRFASRAAAITCTRRGADLPRRAELP